VKGFEIPITLFALSVAFKLVISLVYKNENNVKIGETGVNSETIITQTNNFNNYENIIFFSLISLAALIAIYKFLKLPRQKK